ncbi:MAG: hypothetical protein KA146_02775 [Leptospiraceae bacterium]|nr:hypothetical protein [Leptospiraceae bacterium]
MTHKSSKRSFERIAKTGGALLAVIAGVRVLKTTVLKEIDIKNQYKGLALPVVAYFASDYLPLDPDLKFGVQLGAGVSFLSGALDAMNMSKTKEQIGLAGDNATYQFRNMNEVMDFAQSQLPANQIMHGRSMDAIPDGFSEFSYPVAGEEDFQTSGEQNW